MNGDRATITDKDSQKKTSTAIQDVASKQLSIWCSLDKAAQQHVPTTSQQFRAIAELQTYIEDELIYRKNDPVL